jgi:hypothetical protein
VVLHGEFGFDIRPLNALESELEERVNALNEQETNPEPSREFS